MNEKDYISLEIAKLLVEMFNYNNISLIENCSYIEYKQSNIAKSYPKLGLYEVQKLLREKYNCYVQITYEAYKTRVNYLVQVLFYEPNDDDCWSNKSTGKYGDNAEFKTYEEALNFGILEALKRI